MRVPVTGASLLVGGQAVGEVWVAAWAFAQARGRSGECGGDEGDDGEDRGVGEVHLGDESVDESCCWRGPVDRGRRRRLILRLGCVWNGDCRRRKFLRGWDV